MEKQLSQDRYWRVAKQIQFAPHQERCSASKHSRNELASNEILRSTLPAWVEIVFLSRSIGRFPWGAVASTCVFSKDFLAIWQSHNPEHTEDTKWVSLWLWCECWPRATPASGPPSAPSRQTWCSCRNGCLRCERCGVHSYCKWMVKDLSGRQTVHKNRNLRQQDIFFVYLSGR